MVCDVEIIASDGEIRRSQNGGCTLLQCRMDRNEYEEMKNWLNTIINFLF